MKKDKCYIVDKCPWGSTPQIGMFAKVGHYNTYATDCICYKDCPNKRWTESQWILNRITK